MIDRITLSEIREHIVNVIYQVLDDHSFLIENTARLDKDIGLDSLDIITLTRELESVFNTQISDSEIKNSDTLVDLIVLVVRKLADS